MIENSAILLPMRTIAGKDATKAMTEVITKLHEYAAQENDAEKSIEMEDVAIVAMRINELLYHANTHLDEPLKFSKSDEDNHRMFLNLRNQRLGINEEF
tara:strand:- start:1594 stop:1890 length:297 start_codon:yes stop_codon:yes gene_type:complete